MSNEERNDSIVTHANGGTEGTGESQALEERVGTQVVPDAENLWKVAKGLYQSGMFPNAKNVYGALTLVEYGRELGMPPVISLQTMSVIHGTICIESKVLLAKAISSGVKIKIIEKTKEKAVVSFARKGHEVFTETFTIEDAESIGLTNKQNWKQYPEEMCYWRCVAKGLRAYAPDLFLGLYTKEEVQDFDVGGAFKEEEKKQKEKKQSKKPADTKKKKSAPPKEKKQWPKDVHLTMPDGTLRSTDRFGSLKFFARAKEMLGEDKYYDIMGSFGYEHANQVKTKEEIVKIFNSMSEEIGEMSDE